MKTTSLYRFFLLAAVLLLPASCGPAAEQAETEPVEIRPALGFRTEDYRVDSLQLRSGETFSSLMERLGMGRQDCHTLAAYCDSIFDVRKMRAGNPLEAYYDRDSLAATLRYVVYHHDKVGATVFQCADSLAVWPYERPTEQERKVLDVTLVNSLWADMTGAGGSPNLLMTIADIYQWSVNFFTLQPGDRFQVIYDRSLCDGEEVSIDTVHYCRYTSGTLRVDAVRFTTDRGTAYWGKDGESLRKMFLKAPLRYNRISSRFSYARKHPVTGKVRPHTGVDFAAPTGTPVHAIGDGTVTLCGWDSSGGGNRIKIKHIKGYESAYLHLSRFASGIRQGSRVRQGQLIGYVGSTGRSTGPHLDFRIWENGRAINPLTLNSPSADPLDKKYLAAFQEVFTRYAAEADGN